MIEVRWNNLTDVPLLTIEWAKLIGGQDITLEEINELVLTYEDWLNNISDNHTL